MEYAVVLAGFLAVVAGAGLLMRALGDGIVVEHALAAASHHIQASAGWMADVLGY